MLLMLPFMGRGAGKTRHEGVVERQEVYEGTWNGMSFRLARGSRREAQEGDP
jgi:hypothetical protein